MIRGLISNYPSFWNTLSVETPSFFFSKQQPANPSTTKNFSVIAHVDHGKSSLVEQLLRQSGELSGSFAADDLIMDSNQLEKERGITFQSKNCAIHYKGHTLNLVDTPGHSDFSGEVQRILGMTENAILIIDSAEGVKPQTRYVLQNALELDLNPIIVINKCDKPDSRIDEVEDEVFGLFDELGADDSILEYPTLYASAKDGWAVAEKPNTLPKDGSMIPLLDALIEHSISAPAATEDDVDNFQMMVTSVTHDDFKGSKATGRVSRGKIRVGDEIVVLNRDQEVISETTVPYLAGFKGLSSVDIDTASSGDICSILGIEEIGIGYTIASKANPGPPLKPIKMDEPTLHMEFGVNDSPLAKAESSLINSIQLRARLTREIASNVALKIDFHSSEQFTVSGRGLLHLGILLETMRREGYAVTVSKPQVDVIEKNGQKMEPYEDLSVQVPNDKVKKVTSLLWDRHAEMVTQEERGNFTTLDYYIPSRGIIGLRTRLLTATQGELVMTSAFREYGPMVNDMGQRSQGVLISTATGPSTTYALMNLAPRGTFFLKPGERVYEGEVIGISATPKSIPVNPCKEKQLTNMRAAGKDEKTPLKVPKEFSLEEMLEFIDDTELVDITPVALRIRKKYLTSNLRKQHGESI